MKAIVQDSYGPADVLELRDVDRPSIGADEVLVQVRAAGVDLGVWHLMTGRPYLVRVMGFGLRKPKVAVRGMDLAGAARRVEWGRSPCRLPRLMLWHAAAASLRQSMVPLGCSGGRCCRQPSRGQPGGLCASRHVRTVSAVTTIKEA